MNMSNSYKFNKNTSNLDRLNKLTDKLHSNSENEKNSKFEFLNSRVADVDDHLNEVNDQTNKKFNIIKENVKINK